MIWKIVLAVGILGREVRRGRRRELIALCASDE